MPINADIIRTHCPKNGIFVETGAHLGDGIAAALDAGQRAVYSCDIEPKFINHCKNRFSGDPRVKLFHGDSWECLGDMIYEAQATAIDTYGVEATLSFWLDGHAMSGDAPGSQFGVCPVLAELVQIARHVDWTPTIMIDDVRLFGEAAFAHIPLDMVVSCIKAIQRDYKIQFINSPFCQGDILVATPDFTV